MLLLQDFSLFSFLCGSFSPLGRNANGMEIKENGRKLAEGRIGEIGLSQIKLRFLPPLFCFSFPVFPASSERDQLEV